MPEISASMFSIAIEPSTSTFSSLRSAITRLTSRRVTSQRTRSPRGFDATFGRWTTLKTESVASSSSSTWWHSAFGATILR